MKKKLEEIKKMIGKKVLIKNDLITAMLVKDIVNAKEASYDIKQNAREGLLCVINGYALAIDNTYIYSDDKCLDELISSSSSKEISAFMYETTEISLFPYKKEKIETLCDSFWMT